MKKKLTIGLLSAIILLFFIISFTYGQESSKGLKVFISVDMEGITGVVNWAETGGNTSDYQYFRRVMTKETNAAIEGALEAGATEIIVRDSHGSARNILIEELNPAAKLLRDWSGGYMSMMEGIDETFDAVIFVGYHAKAGTPNAVLEHTMTGSIMDVKINGISVPEAGINAAIAGYFNVPVVFISGDKAVCEQAKSLFGDIETVAVKKGLGSNAALNLPPEKTRKLIKKGVKRALERLKDFKPWKLKSPYTIEVTFKKENMAYRASLYPGAKRTGDWSVAFTSYQFLDIIKFFALTH
ncbi:hypothetical protein DRQ09_05455 [candidate division KSB1 bacterium]|nr:MAG: hypothetical protein DRQ09_05455 [candidate division KSB1 bacterium]